MGETGRTPLYTHILCQIIKYRHRLDTQQEGNLLDSAKTEQTKLGSKTWLKQVDDMICHYSLGPMMCKTTLGKHHCKNISETIEKAYKKFWQQSTKDSPKLDCYAKYKSDIYYEPYLDQVSNRDHQVALTKLRVSQHDLEVERGRYTRPKKDRKDRTCRLCQSGKVEDEEHFLFECPVFADERTSHIPTENRTLKLALHRYTETSICKTAQYIHQSNVKRKHLLSQVMN